jgi:hypothetical protein
MRRNHRRNVLTLGVAIVLGLVGGNAKAQNCTISTSQYGQLRSRLLGGSGTLTQGYCNVDPINDNDCSNPANNTKHTGIDYGAPLGTAVYAPVGGVVRRVDPGTCAGTSCSLSTLAIYNSRMAVTYVFLHLESILVSEAAEVVSGQKIGTVGKRGAVGYHLHYEVRAGDRSYAASCFDSTSNPFHDTSFLWDFNISSNLEGWAGFNLSSLSSSGQILLLNPSGSDPYVVGPTINADAGVFKHVKLRMASNALDGSGVIYFKTAANNTYSESRKVTFTATNFCSLCGNAPYSDYEVNMGSNSGWAGVITGIRLDPANNGLNGTSSDSIGLQYLMLWP